MWTGDTTEALDYDQDDQTEVECRLEVIVFVGIILYTTHTAEEDQQSGADELTEEAAYFIQCTVLHFKFFKATERRKKSGLLSYVFVSCEYLRKS